MCNSNQNRVSDFCGTWQALPKFHMEKIKGQKLPRQIWRTKLGNLSYQISSIFRTVAIRCPSGWCDQSSSGDGKQCHVLFNLKLQRFSFFPLLCLSMWLNFSQCCGIAFVSSIEPAFKSLVPILFFSLRSSDKAKYWSWCYRVKEERVFCYFGEFILNSGSFLKSQTRIMEKVW